MIGVQNPQSGVTSGVDLPELCEKRDEKKYAVEYEEEDAIGPTQVELAERNDDKRQDQGQAQRSCKNPHQQALRLKLRRKTRENQLHTAKNSVFSGY